MTVIASTTALGLQGTIDAAVVTNVYSAVVSGVLVGHYVKTANAHNGALSPPPPGGKTTIETPATTTIIEAPPPGEPL